ncbi:MAG: hypothetical protein O3A00_24555, partial [Planctomycetota bacterium]|nr:hypothetical protein [Planctomycetota bacterium]
MADWQKDRGPARRPTRDWQYQGQNPGSEKRARRIQMIFGSLLILGLSGAIIYFVTRVGPTPTTRLVLVAIADYGSRQIPPNPGAIKDRDQLEAATKHAFNSVKRFDDVSTGRSMLKEFDDQLGQMEENQLVMFCSMHGLVVPGDKGTTSGHAVLLALNANGDSLQTQKREDVVLVRDLLTTVKNHADKKVLLLFDIGRLDPDWRIGHLSNDFSRQLQFEMDEIKVPNLRIICSSGRNETSWWNPETKQSVFGQFVASGLAGAADLDQSTRIEVNELLRYLQSNVAESNRGRTQTVQSLGDPDFSFEIVAVSAKPEVGEDDANAEESDEAAAETGDAKSASAVAAKTGDAEAAEKEQAKKADPAAVAVRLEALWDRRDKLRPEHPEQVMPHRWRSVQSYLVRGERQLRGNLPIEASKTLELAAELLDGVDQSLSAASLFSPNTRLRHHSLTTARLSKVEPFKDGEKLIAKLGEITATQPEAGKPDPAQEVRDLIAKDEGKPSAIVAATQWVVDRIKSAKNRDDIQFLKYVVNKKLMGDPSEWPLELFIAKRWSDAAGATSLAWDMNKFHELLELMQRAETLLLEVGTEALPIARQDLVKALKELMAAEQWLCRGNDQLSRQAQSHLKEARSLLLKIDEPNGHARLFTATVRLRDQLLAELPDYADWIARLAEVDSDRKLDWQRLIDFAAACEKSETDSAWRTGHELKWPLDDGPSGERELFDLMLATRRLTWLIEETRTADEAESAQKRRELFNAENSVRSQWTAFKKARDTELEKLEALDAVIAKNQREIEQALFFPWIDAKRRTKLRLKLQQKPIESDSSSVREAGIWSGLWGIHVLGLASFDEVQTPRLWRQWGSFVTTISKLEELPKDSGERATVERAIVYERAGLGVALSVGWSRIASELDRGQHENPALADRMGRIVNGMDLAQADAKSRSKADETVVATRKKSFADWMAVQGRAQQAAERLFGLESPLISQIDKLLRDIGWNGNVESFSAHVGITLNDGKREVDPASDRQATLSIQLPDVDVENWKLQFKLQHASLSLKDANSDKVWPIPVNGVWPIPKGKKRRIDISVKVPENFNEPQGAVVALIGPDGLPRDIHSFVVNQPFDPNQWRVRFTTAEGKDLSNSRINGGRKLELPPFAIEPLELKAVLETPAGVQPVKAEVVVSRMDLSKLEWEEIARTTVEVQANVKETPISISLPPPPADDGGAKVKSGPVSLEISSGLLFRIEAAGKEPIQYV